MGAPVLSARLTPLGIPLFDGYSTTISFNADPDISFWEKTVTPPGIDGGDAIDHTTMHNSTWRTLGPRSLKTLTEFTLTAAYDPDLYDEICALLNVATSITVHFPDLSTLVFFGFLRLFEPGAHEEGAQPECTITITPTNWDPVNLVESAPVMTETAGT